jgi:hypothetical protein
MPMVFPLLICFVIVILFREELGFPGILITAAIVIGGFIICLSLHALGWFTVLLAIIDIVLVVMLFGNVRLT